MKISFFFFSANPRNEMIKCKKADGIKKIAKPKNCAPSKALACSFDMSMNKKEKPKSETKNDRVQNALSIERRLFCIRT
jgi:hypothetical protein